MNNRNQTSIIIAVLSLVAIMFTGVVVIALYRPDATATVIAFVGSTLTTTVGAIVVLYNLNKVKQVAERVEKQTNGINTAMLAKVTGMSAEEIDSHKGL